MKRVWGILFFLLVFSNVNAAIFIEDNFENKYNLGERVVLEFKLSSDITVGDFMQSYLSCDGDEFLVDKRYVFLDAESMNFEIEFPLNEEGKCQFEIFFKNEEAVSDDFEVSSQIKLDYSLNDKYFFPEEILIVRGNVTKFNGEDYSGVLNFNLGSFVKKTYNVKNGSFEFEHRFSKYIAPEEYGLVLEVSKKDLDGNILNEGKIVDTIVVQPKITALSIEFPDAVEPGSENNFSVHVLDQANNLIRNETVIVKLVDSNSDIIFNKEVESDSVFSYNFSSDFLRGSAYLNAYYGDISEKVPIYVMDNKEISVAVFESQIVFTNIGNVVYEGIVSYELQRGNETIEEFTNVSLGLGESYFEVLDYEGTYNISSMNSKFNSVNLITGQSILMDNFRNFSWFSVFIVTLFFVTLFFGYFQVRKKLEKNSFFSLPAEKDYRRAIKKLSKEKRSVNVKENKKMVLSSNDPVTAGPLRIKAFMIFLKVDSRISDYAPLFNKYGFRLNVVGSGIGYSIFYKKEGGIKLENKAFNFARAVKRYAESRGDFVSLVLNRGFLEKKISILKKFALFNKEILDNFPGKFVVSRNIMEDINMDVEREEQSIEIMGRKIKLWLIGF